MYRHMHVASKLWIGFFIFVVLIGSKSEVLLDHYAASFSLNFLSFWFFLHNHWGLPIWHISWQVYFDTVIWVLWTIFSLRKISVCSKKPQVEDEQPRHALHSEDLDGFNDLELKPMHNSIIIPNSIKESILSGACEATTSAPPSAGLREPIYADLNKTRAGSTPSCNNVHWKASSTSIERHKSSFVDMDGS